ncbi:unnamed protein product, partial [Discosporangium mesarthrocarpum]
DNLCRNPDLVVLVPASQEAEPLEILVSLHTEEGDGLQKRRFDRAGGRKNGDGDSSSAAVEGPGGGGSTPARETASGSGEGSPNQSAITGASKEPCLTPMVRRGPAGGKDEEGGGGEWERGGTARPGGVVGKGEGDRDGAGGGGGGRNSKGVTKFKGTGGREVYKGSRGRSRSSTTTCDADSGNGEKPDMGELGGMLGNHQQQRLRLLTDPVDEHVTGEATSTPWDKRQGRCSPPPMASSTQGKGLGGAQGGDGSSGGRGPTSVFFGDTASQCDDGYESSHGEGGEGGGGHWRKGSEKRSSSSEFYRDGKGGNGGGGGEGGRRDLEGRGLGCHIQVACMVRQSYKLFSNFASPEHPTQRQRVPLDGQDEERDVYAMVTGLFKQCFAIPRDVATTPGLSKPFSGGRSGATRTEGCVAFLTFHEPLVKDKGID